MKKFVISKDTDCQYLLKKSYNITTNDLYDLWENNDQFQNPIAEFETQEEAETFFEKEKANCLTKITSGTAVGIISFDVLTLDEIETDEDGDPVWIDSINIFINDLDKKSEI